MHLKLQPGVVGIVIGVPAAILLAACSSSSSTPSSAPSTTSASATTTTTSTTANFDSCSVVTQAEATSAIGTSVTAGVLGNATVEGGLACVFYGPSAPTPTTPNAAQADSVRVVVVKGSNALTWYNDYKSKVNAQPITGYGDQAYYDGYASLSVLKGDYYLRIAVSPAGAAPSLSDEEQLATAILPKL
jgi:lipopolysaccharide export system protein LptA